MKQFNFLNYIKNNPLLKEQDEDGEAKVKEIADEIVSRLKAIPSSLEEDQLRAILDEKDIDMGISDADVTNDSAKVEVSFTDKDGSNYFFYLDCNLSKNSDGYVDLSKNRMKVTVMKPGNDKETPLYLGDDFTEIVDRINDDNGNKFRDLINGPLNKAWKQTKPQR